MIAIGAAVPTGNVATVHAEYGDCRHQCGDTDTSRTGEGGVHQ
jgi:hypothetical protein